MTARGDMGRGANHLPSASRASKPAEGRLLQGIRLHAAQVSEHVATGLHRRWHPGEQSLRRRFDLPPPFAHEAPPQVVRPWPDWLDWLVSALKQHAWRGIYRWKYADRLQGSKSSYQYAEGLAKLDLLGAMMGPEGVSSDRLSRLLRGVLGRTNQREANEGEFPVNAGDEFERLAQVQQEILGDDVASGGVEIDVAVGPETNALARYCCLYGALLQLGVGIVVSADDGGANVVVGIVTSISCSNGNCIWTVRNYYNEQTDVQLVQLEIKPGQDGASAKFVNPVRQEDGSEGFPKMTIRAALGESQTS